MSRCLRSEQTFFDEVTKKIVNRQPGKVEKLRVFIFFPTFVSLYRFWRPFYFSPPAVFSRVLWGEISAWPVKSILLRLTTVLRKFGLTSPQSPAFHRGQALRSHRSVVNGFVSESQLISLSLHSTERILVPDPQVTEHCKRKEEKFITAATYTRLCGYI